VKPVTRFLLTSGRALYGITNRPRARESSTRVGLSHRKLLSEFREQTGDGGLPPRRSAAMRFDVHITLWVEMAPAARCQASASVLFVGLERLCFGRVELVSKTRHARAFGIPLVGVGDRIDPGVCPLLSQARLTRRVRCRDGLSPCLAPATPGRVNPDPERGMAAGRCPWPRSPVRGESRYGLRDRRQGSA